MRAKEVLDELSDSELSDELEEEYNSDEDVKPTESIAGILKGSLREPRFKTLSVRQLYDLIQTGNVNLDPDYQRAVVWPEKRQIYLIQSLFQNFFIPPVIFAIEFDEDEGIERRVCIDGKQRCTSIRKVIDGELPFISPATKERFWYQSHPGQGRSPKMLPLALKQKFDNLQIMAAEYDGLNLEQQRDIFQRVQLGMPLTAAEKLQGLGGLWSQWVRGLEKKYIHHKGALGETLPKFQAQRARTFQSLGMLVSMVYDPAGLVFPSNERVKKFLERTDRPERSFQLKVEMTLAIFVRIAAEYFDTAFGNIEARVAPVEFCGIGFLIYQRMNTMSVVRLAEEIARMRALVRERHVDVRSNNVVFKSIYDYISTVPAGKKPGEIAAREEFNGSDNDDVQTDRLKKRQREEEDDGTYHDSGPTRDGESAVVGSLRSKKSARVQNKSPSKAAAAASITRPAAPAPPSVASRSPPPAYNPRPAPAIQPPAPAPARPAPIGMDAPNRGPAYVSAPPPNRSPPYAGRSPYGTVNRSPPQAYGMANRSPQHQPYAQQTFRNSFPMQGHGYQQPPYGGRRL